MSFSDINVERGVAENTANSDIHDLYQDFSSIAGSVHTDLDGKPNFDWFDALTGCWGYFCFVCFSIFAAFNKQLLETQHITQRVLKQNARYCLPAQMLGALSWARARHSMIKSTTTKRIFS